MNTKVHIGKLIEKKLKDDRYSASWLAEKMFCSRQNVYRIFQKQHIHPVQLGQISKILHYNFFLHYCDI